MRLCSGSHGGAGLVVATPELALATIGLYGVVLFAPQLWELGAGARAAVGGSNCVCR